MGFIDFEGLADGDPEGAAEGAVEPEGADDGAGLEVVTHVPHENGHFAEWVGQRLAILIAVFFMFALM